MAFIGRFRAEMEYRLTFLFFLMNRKLIDYGKDQYNNLEK